jgi:hypothetical protein
VKTLLTVAAPEDSEIEVANMRPGVGTCIPFPSIWGHWAGGEIKACGNSYLCFVNLAIGPGQSTEDVKWLDEKLKDFFEGNDMAGLKASLSDSQGGVAVAEKSTGVPG